MLRSLGGIVTYPPENPYDRRIALTPGQTYRNKTRDWGISGELNYDFGGATLTSITAYRYYKSGNVGDIDYSNVDIANRANDGNAYRRFRTFTQELRLQGSAFNDRLDWLVGAYYGHEKLQLVDNFKFGSQYGAFASCRAVATVNPLAALRNPAASGCLSPTGRFALGQAFTQLFGSTAAQTLLGGLDRLSRVNNMGDQRAVYDQLSENYAFFTHNIFKVTDTVSLTVGARWTHEKKVFDGAFNNNNTICPQQQAALGPLVASSNAQLQQLAGGIVTLTCQGNSSSSLNALDLHDSFKDSEWTGTAVLSWKPLPQLLTYASYSKGYKAGGYNLDRSDLGGINGVFSPRTNADAKGLRFEPEKVDAYEIGFKYNGRKFNVNVAAFRQEFKTFQLNTFNGSIFIVQNIASCKDGLNGADIDNSPATGACSAKTKAGVISQGVEVEASLYPIPNVALTAGYTYADTHYRKNLVGSSTGEALSNALFLLPGSQLSNAPKHVVTGSFAWTPEIGSSGLTGLLYVDARYSSRYNTGSDLFPEKEQKGFAVVNARIGIRGRDELWALEFWGQNIFNKEYQQVAFNTPFQGSGSIAQTAAFGVVGNQLFSSYLAEPRTYGVTLRSKF